MIMFPLFPLISPPFSRISDPVIFVVWVVASYVPYWFIVKFLRMMLLSLSQFNEPLRVIVPLEVRLAFELSVK